jgi:hypothetical protein
MRTLATLGYVPLGMASKKIQESQATVTSNVRTPIMEREREREKEILRETEREREREREKEKERKKERGEGRRRKREVVKGFSSRKLVQRVLGFLYALLKAACCCWHYTVTPANKDIWFLSRCFCRLILFQWGKRGRGKIRVNAQSK